jgi:hypothetical protein
MPRAMVTTDYGTARQLQAHRAAMRARGARRDQRLLPVKDTGFMTELIKNRYVYLSKFPSIACKVVPP